MKHLMKLNIGVQIVCDESMAEDLKTKGIQLAEENVFTQNSKAITDFKILDEELCDDSMPIGLLWTSRGIKGIEKPEPKQNFEVSI